MDQRGDTSLVNKTFLSRPRLLSQDQDRDQDSRFQDQDQDLCFCPRDQDLGLEDYITG